MPCIDDSLEIYNKNGITRHLGTKKMKFTVLNLADAFVALQFSENPIFRKVPDPQQINKERNISGGIVFLIYLLVKIWEKY
jgi:hypothetical protein